MLRRKLIAIAVLVLGLGITSVHAQKDKLGNFEIQDAIKKPTSKQIKPGNSGGTITNQRTSGKSSRIRKRETTRSVGNYMFHVEIDGKSAGWRAKKSRTSNRTDGSSKIQKTNRKSIQVDSNRTPNLIKQRKKFPTSSGDQPELQRSRRNRSIQKRK